MAAKKWDGTGTPPSVDAALVWLKAEGFGDPSSYKSSWSKLSLAKVGSEARNAAKNTRPPSHTTSQGTNTTQLATTAKKAAPTKKAAKTGDSALVTPPNLSGVGTNDQPLLPYTAGADVLAAVPARYHESDALRPQTEGWSPEKKAGLQRQLMSIGLYGTSKTTLGTWGAQDQEALVALLTEANITGRSMGDQLKEWSIRPPTTDQLAAALGTKPKAPLTVQLTNPADVRSSAENVSQQMLGHIDTGFVNSAPAGYNAQETQGQTAAYNAANADAGGTSYQAPSQSAYLEDKLRREKPLEVGAHSFLNTWNNFLGLLGPGGGKLSAEA